MKTEIKIWALLRAAICFDLLKANAEKSGFATLIFGGDVDFSGPIKYLAEKGRGCDYKKPFTNIKSFLNDADYTIINLETPLLSNDPEGNELLPGKNVKLAGEPRALEGLVYAGIDAVTIANNHFLDFGEKGANITIKALRKHKIKVIGATFGLGGKARQRPLIKKINGITIGILAYCYFRDGCENSRDETQVGPALFTKHIALEDIRDLTTKRQVDFVIVIMHWGIEMIPAPSLFMRNLAITLTELGANLIVGNHPHVTQGHEYMGLARSTLVEYSLGNLLFPSRTSVKKVFRPYGKGDDKLIKKFANSANVPWDFTRFGYLLKVKLAKGKILNSWVKHFEISFNSTNNCLQPTPDDTQWIEVCSSEDRAYCLEFEKIYSSKRREPFDVHLDKKLRNSV